MNVNDIKTALQFMVEGLHRNDRMWLQCKTARDIPYIKRELFRLLGQPNKMIGVNLYYNPFVITVVPLSMDLTGVAEHSVFYVAYKDNSDWHELCANSGAKHALVPYMQVPWVSLSDVYTWLVRDGHRGDRALHMMRCDGLI